MNLTGKEVCVCMHISVITHFQCHNYNRPHCSPQGLMPILLSDARGYIFGGVLGVVLFGGVCLGGGVCGVYCYIINL